MVYGRQRSTCLNTNAAGTQEESTYCNNIATIQKNCKIWQAEALKKMNENSDRYRQEPFGTGYKVGDLVMLRKHWIRGGEVKKLSELYEGPYEIMETARPNYIINYKGKKKMIHGNNLKKYRQSEPIKEDEENDLIIQVEKFENKMTEGIAESSDEDDPFSFVTGYSRYGRLRRKRIVG